MKFPRFLPVLAILACTFLWATPASANMWLDSILGIGFIAAWWTFVLPIVFEVVILKYVLGFDWYKTGAVVLLANAASSIAGFLISLLFAGSMVAWFDRAVGYRYLFEDSPSKMDDFKFFTLFVLFTTLVNWMVETPIILRSKGTEKDRKITVAAGVLIANLGSCIVMLVMFSVIPF